MSGVDEEFDLDQAQVVIGDVEQCRHQLVPDAASRERIMNHDGHDLSDMVDAPVKGNQCCCPNDAAVDLRHQLMLIRA